MAPEQFRGTISKESDQYALGCIAYELFTGHQPFTASDFVAMGFLHVTETPVAPTKHNPQLPLHIEQAILKAMAKQRADRHANMALWRLNRNEEALTISEHALQLDPNYISTYNIKGLVLDALNRYPEALAAHEQAIRLNPNYTLAYNEKGNVLKRLGRLKEAEAAYEKARQLGYRG